MILKNVRDGLHGNSRVARYAVNYQLTAAIQQMGCGSVDAVKLAGFLEMGCGDRIDRNIAAIESLMGPMQEKLRESCEQEAVMEEVLEMKRRNELEYHACDIPGHRHPPLPKLKISYGEYFCNN